jgi:hypothetical protein
MDQIVMTLLVRRNPEAAARWPYAAQIALSVELAPGEMTTVTSVRLITNQGAKSSILAAMDFYHPHEWRAASLAEQADYVVRFNGNPRPWYCVMRSLCKNVYDYAGAGDRDTNNGQVWKETASTGNEWKTARRLEQSCHEELEADWSRNLGGAVHSAVVSGRRRRNSVLTTS